MREMLAVGLLNLRACVYHCQSQEQQHVQKAGIYFYLFFSRVFAQGVVLGVIKWWHEAPVEGMEGKEGKEGVTLIPLDSFEGHSRRFDGHVSL